MSAKGIWIAFGLGVSAGAAVALLYAPHTGARTRKLLKKNINEGVDYLEDAAAYLKEQADKLSAEAQKTVERTRSQMNGAIDQATGAVTGVVKSAQSLM